MDCGPMRGLQRPGVFRRSVTGDLVLATNAHNDDRDIRVVAYSPRGRQHWTGTYDGGFGAYENSYGLALDQSGSAYVVGAGGGPIGTSQRVTVKFGIGGEILWSSRYGPQLDHQQAAAIAVTNDVVYTYGNDENWDSIITVAYDAASGAELWVRTFPVEAQAAMAAGGAVDDAGNALALGSYDVGGYLLIQYSSEGEELWAIQEFVGYHSAARALTVDDDGNIYVALAVWGQQADFRIVKYGSDGHEIWQASFDGPRHLDDVPEAIVLDEAGNVYVAGWTELERSCETGCHPIRSETVLLALDRDGNRKWVDTFDGGGGKLSRAWDVDVDRFGNVFICGDTSSGSRQYLTVRYSQPPEACAGRERMRVSCAPKGDAHVVRARGRRGAKGDRVTLCLDGGDCHETQVDYTGRATSRWKDVEDGEHTVTAAWACGADDERRVRCDGP